MSLLTSLVAILGLGAPIAAPTQSLEPLFEGLGGFHRKVQTTSPDAQKYVDQGLAFLFAFNHDEATRSFQQATHLDPSCAMAWWGIATANGPHINNPMVDPANAMTAWNALQKANALAPKAPKVERDLIGAAMKRFSSNPSADRGPLDKAYAAAMRTVWRAHPKDADVGALFAESMMDLRPWDLWKPDGSPQPGTSEIRRTLEAVMKLNPKQPLANHLYIHTMEASPNPEKAIGAADRLRFLQPGLGHMVHMPSHIDVRTGRWAEAVAANLRAIEADKSYRAKSQRQGFYRVYMAHNHHMLAFAAMMTGQSELSIKAMDDVITIFPDEVLKEMAPLVDGFMASPFEGRVRFGKWEEIVAMPLVPDYFPLARSLQHEARSVSYAAMGMVEAARAEQSMFYAARKKVPKDAAFGNNAAADILTVATHLMNGEILLAEGKIQASIAELKKGVKAEDQLRYDEPPDWIQPVRHTLGAVLLKAGRHAEAEQVYRDDLKRLPGNGWSLFGLGQALRAQGKAEAAATAESHFAKVWAKADMSIQSSCLCVQGK
ncbi:MAG: hypothetical protein KF784_08100 [Fimbriimonadaceae bacterium]|nr:hypothetical protein [Fimbriimonadaceae bacterium]